MLVCVFFVKEFFLSFSFFFSVFFNCFSLMIHFYYYIIDYLQARLNLETSQPTFSELPFRFAEVAKVILDVLVLFLLLCPQTFIKFYCYSCHIKSASDDLENPDKLRSLLKDLREARQAKSRDGLKTLDHSELSVSLL